jgi:hypothetical protein
MCSSNECIREKVLASSIEFEHLCNSVAFSNVSHARPYISAVARIDGASSPY